MGTGPLEGYDGRNELQHDDQRGRTLDGDETSWTFYGGRFKARDGHLVSSIDAQDRPLLAYNHSTDQLTAFDEAIRRANRIPLLWAWLATAVFGTVLLSQAVLAFDASTHPSEPTAPPTVGVAWGVAGILSALASLVSLGLTAFVFSTLRNWSFKRYWAPRFLAFMKESTPALLQRFTPTSRLEPAR